MGHLRGAEKRGCGYRVKKARIYVQMQLQIHSSSRRVLSSRSYIFRKRKKSMALGKMFGSIFPVTSGREEG
jgi:hypothetical protein